jgi:hypothetical protein
VNEQKTRLEGEIATLKEDVERRGDRINVLTTSVSKFRQEKERSLEDAGRLVAQHRALNEGYLIVASLTVDLRIVGKEKANVEAEKNKLNVRVDELVKGKVSCVIIDYSP